MIKKIREYYRRWKWSWFWKPPPTYVWKDGDPLPQHLEAGDDVTVATWNRALTDHELGMIQTRGEWPNSLGRGLTLLVVRPTV